MVIADNVIWLWWFWAHTLVLSLFMMKRWLITFIVWSKWNTIGTQGHCVVNTISFWLLFNYFYLCNSLLAFFLLFLFVNQIIMVLFLILSIDNIFLEAEHESSLIFNYTSIDIFRCLRFLFQCIKFFRFWGIRIAWAFIFFLMTSEVALLAEFRTYTRWIIWV